MKKLTPYEIWKKVNKEKLSKAEYKQLLIDNDILIIKKDESVKVCAAPKDYVCNVNNDGVCELPTFCVYRQTQEILYNEDYKKRTHKQKNLNE